MLSRFRHEDVHHDSTIVHGHPFRVLSSGDVSRFFVCLFASKFLNAVSDGIHLQRVSRRTDYEVGTGSSNNMSQIYRNDAASFFS